MKYLIFCMLITIANSLPSHVLASDDNFYAESCVLYVQTIGNTTDPRDTESNCRFIRKLYSWECVSAIAESFTKYPSTDDSVYDGIDSNHIFACSLLNHFSSVTCLNEILKLRRPTVSDILACSNK